MERESRVTGQGPHISEASEEALTVPLHGLCAIEAPAVSKAREWSLVLAANGIRHWLDTLRGKAVLTLECQDYDLAVREIEEYERENINWPPAPPSLHQAYRNEETTVWVLLALTAFSGIWLSPRFAEFKEAGAAWAGKIMEGQWWRAGTALTIHADPGHLMGNILLGGFIMVHVAKYTGGGMAWFMAVVSGITGNLLNAWIQPYGHVSVGSSTAIFGVTGAAAAYRGVCEGVSSGIKRFALPIGAAIALLGFTGTAGERTDLMAHLLGFASGIVTGGATGLMVLFRGKPGRNTQYALGMAALLMIVTCWLALWVNLSGGWH